MAKIEISWTDDSGLKREWSSSKGLTDKSAMAVYGSISPLMTELAKNFKLADATGKIPEPTYSTEPLPMGKLIVPLPASSKEGK